MNFDKSMGAIKQVRKSKEVVTAKTANKAKIDKSSKSDKAILADKSDKAILPDKSDKAILPDKPIKSTKPIKPIKSIKSTKPISFTNPNLPIYKCKCGNVFRTNEIIFTFPLKVECTKCEEHLIICQQPEYEKTTRL
jgi:hypothetical protein